MSIFEFSYWEAITLIILGWIIVVGSLAEVIYIILCDCQDYSHLIVFILTMTIGLSVVCGIGWALLHRNQERVEVCV